MHVRAGKQVSGLRQEIKPQKGKEGKVDQQARCITRLTKQ